MHKEGREKQRHLTQTAQGVEENQEGAEADRRRGGGETGGRVVGQYRGQIEGGDHFHRLLIAKGGLRRTEQCTGGWWDRRRQLHPT